MTHQIKVDSNIDTNKDLTVKTLHWYAIINPVIRLADAGCYLKSCYFFNYTTQHNEKAEEAVQQPKNISEARIFNREVLKLMFCLCCHAQFWRRVQETLLHNKNKFVRPSDPQSFLLRDTNYSFYIKLLYLVKFQKMYFQTFKFFLFLFLTLYPDTTAKIKKTTKEQNKENSQRIAQQVISVSF